MKVDFNSEKRFLYFMISAMLACLINMIAGNAAGYANSFTNNIYIAAILVLCVFTIINKAGYHLTALVLSAIFFNVFFCTFSYLYGFRSLISIYYFPFITAFIYMFKDKATKTNAVTFFIICLAFLVPLILFCPIYPTVKGVTDEHTVAMARKNFIVSLALSAYYFYAIFNYVLHQHNKLKRQKEIAEEASQSKARFLSVMSHELRTPLNGIVGMINLMHDSTSEMDKEKYLPIIKTSSQHLLHLVNNVLDYSKASAGKMELTPVPVSFHSILSNIYSVFLPRFEEKGLNLVLDIAPQLKKTVLADDVRIVQVLTNLLSNALKFTDSGKVVLQGHCKNVDAAQMELEISVTDSGRGVTAEQKTQIFDSFNNIDNKSRHAESTGLGLSISKMIIEMMGGTLDLESELNKGTRFYFQLQLQVVQSETKTIEQVELNVPSSLKGINVLIAEDNPINMMIAREFLKKWQITITEAKNGLIAQQILKEKQHFDLLLLDLQMPEMNGYELMEWIQQELPDLPVIAFTASMLATEEKQELYKMGFVDMVPKPFSPKELEEKMKRSIEVKKTKKEIAA